MLIVCTGSQKVEHFFMFQFSVNKLFLLRRSICDVCSIFLFSWYSEVSGDREVQRTMLELLNQLDGFSSDERIKVIAATNRADILDPALMRSGRLDRKIEFPHPSEEARARILQVGLHNLCSIC
jgi:AAA+ superfamily predicted ATPase